MSLDPVWAPVIAALGSSFLTLLGTVGWDQRKERRANRAAEMQEQHAAYQEVLNRSMTFALRAKTLGDAMRVRSGLSEGLAVALWQRREVDPFELYEWIDRDFRPLGDAWARIWVVGTQEAIDAADKLVTTCGELMAAATARPQRGFISRVQTFVVGELWSEEQLVAFVKVMRREMDKKTVRLALDHDQLSSTLYENERR